jgi:Holliday junction resolvase
MLEAALTKKILKYLRGKGGFWMKTHGGPMQVQGIPDIIGCYLGRFLALEVKRPGKDATPLQAHTIERIIRSGGISGVIHSVEEAEAFLNMVPKDSEKGGNSES